MVFATLLVFFLVANVASAHYRTRSYYRYGYPSRYYNNYYDNWGGYGSYGRRRAYISGPYRRRCYR